jgi:type II secretory pathway component PulJ
VTLATRLRGERGEFSLIGVLVAMTLFLAVLGATLSIFETGLTVQRETVDRAEAQDRARVTIDTLTRQLRNLASPTPDQPQAIDRKTPTDLIFQTVDPVRATTTANVANVKRVRYCLDSNRRLYRQDKRYATASLPTAPPATACPGDGWDSAPQLVVQDVTNNAGGLTRPVFRYNAGVATDVTSIRVDLFIDVDSERGPKETEMASGVFLRNQNRKPTALFTGSKTAGGIILNASASADPEGDPLTYCWYDNTTGVPTVTAPLPCPAGKYIGSGVVFQYPVSTTPRSITLIVKDAADLAASYTADVGD